MTVMTVTIMYVIAAKHHAQAWDYWLDRGTSLGRKYRFSSGRRNRAYIKRLRFRCVPCVGRAKSPPFPTREHKHTPDFSWLYCSYFYRDSGQQNIICRSEPF